MTRRGDSLRCFVAIRLGAEIEATLLRAATSLGQHGAAVRWVPPANMHLTLKFLGHVPRPQVDDVVAALRGIEPGGPLSLRVDGLGRFPERGPARVLWAALEGDTTRLAVLVEAVESALEPLEFARERRGFHPHVTLGRVKGPRGVTAVVEQLEQFEVASQPTTVDGFVLMQSVLLSSGPRYHEVARFAI